MNHTYVGIDFSISSPGVTVYKDNQYYFYSVQRKLSKKAKQLNELQNVTVELCPDEGLSAFEYYDKMTDMLMRWIFSTIGPNPLFALEDWIYSLRGNSLINIVYATSILRYKLIKKYGETSMHYFAPTAVKKFATGKGNADKNMMLEHFKLKCNDIILKEYSSTLEATEKPLEDIIDSYFICEMLRNTNTENH